MARPLWSGSLSFGLVNVPVQLVSAVNDLDLHFRQLHGKDKVPIEQRRYCSEEDVEVEWQEVARAYDLDGKQVVVTDEELESVQPRKTRTIDIEAFADLEDIDPIHLDHPYFLVPAGDSQGTLRAYQLLASVMAKTDRAAIGRFVMRTKEYLVAVRERDGALALSTMRFADEVRPTKPVPAGGKKPSKAQLDKAVAIIESLSVEWDHSRYETATASGSRRSSRASASGARSRRPSPSASRIRSTT
jgi:DNA end-binding protein Ku